ncbi:glycosyltransferase family 4 protein [Patescibacteria group bacterium]|nr:glycosyltransferase family 4 protein [Patescibacteria group bacterium]
MPEKSILYIITKSVWGGAARYVFDLAVNLSGDFSVSIAAGGKGKFYQKIKETSLPYYDISNFQKSVNPLKDIFAFFEILSLIFKIKPDVIHVNSSKAGGVAGVAGKIYQLISSKKVCLIFTAHGWAFNEDRSKWQIDLIKLFSKLTCLFYNKIICVSEYDRQTALKYNIAAEKKLITIHNGIDFEHLSFLSKEQAREKLLKNPITDPTSQECGASKLIIGSIAEWTKNKGLAYLLKAVKRINPPDNGFNLVLIGSGENPDKDRMRRLIDKYQLKNVHLIEWIDNAASYLKAFDIFILPSLKEGLPYTILEAMSAELPIIATNVGGIPEIIDDNFNGFLIKSKNSRQLAEKILYLIKHPERAQETAKRGREKVAKEFNLKEMVKKTKETY